MVLEKHEWEDIGGEAASLRPTVVPSLVAEAVVYVRIAPMSLEELKEQAGDTNTAKERSGQS